MASCSHEIVHNFDPFFKIYIKRLIGTEIVPPSTSDPETGVRSKDVVIAPDKQISARLFLPTQNLSPGYKLPILVYFHGGAFTVESAFSPTYHNRLNLVVAEANVIAVSVNYRRAPENPLPTAFEDSSRALKWVASQSGGESAEAWLNNYGDFSRVYFAGDSAGANIARNVAMLAGLEDLDSEINIAGVILNCPHFGGKEPIGIELENKEAKIFFDNLWLFVYPTASPEPRVDHPSNNPAKDPNLSRLGTGRVLIHVAEKDVLKDRGWYYKDVLSASGWVGNVEVAEFEDEDHVFYLNDPTSENAAALLKRVVDFLNR